MLHQAQDLGIGVDARLRCASTVEAEKAMLAGAHMRCEGVSRV